MRGCATDDQGRLNWIWFSTSGDRAISQIQYCSLSHQRFVMPLQQNPTRDTNNNQNARRDCKQCALLPEFLGFSEFGKISIAGTARTQMIEPLFRFVKWHRSRCDSPQNVRAWTSAAFGIWELLEQTTAKCIQEPLFLSRRISFCVQPSLLAAKLLDYLIEHNYAPVRFRGSRTRALHRPNNVLSDLLQVVLEFHFGLLFCHT